MLNLRLRLMLIYALTSLALLAAVSAVIYALTVRYFRAATERALLERMALEFQNHNAPLPPPLQPYRPQQARELRDTDVGTLASTFVFSFDSSGKAANFNPWNPPIEPNREAYQAVQSTNLDWRTIETPDDTRVRLLTYRMTREGGPQVLQVGRVLDEQDAALRQLLLGLLALWGSSAVILGWGSWWLAGRAVRPTQIAWQKQQAFVASASHELRTPLTLIRASSEVALKTSASDDPNRELLQDVLDETDHMAQLVDDLLLLSRLDAARLKFDFETINVAELLSDLTRQVQVLADQRGINLALIAPQGMIWADRTRLRQVLLIILDNALQHTPAGGTITLSSAVQHDHVTIEVHDTGEGIAPEHLPHIFERFYRADTSRGNQRNGSGLGLSIAKALIEQQHGMIAATSTLNHGTTMRICLGDRR